MRQPERNIEQETREKNEKKQKKRKKMLQNKYQWNTTAAVISSAAEVMTIQFKL